MRARRPWRASAPSPPTTTSGWTGRAIRAACPALSPAARLLAAADVHHALREDRPHRPARSAQEAAAILRGQVREGRLDGAAADAVLRADGREVDRRREWPAGLTAREVEVLRLAS